MVKTAVIIIPTYNERGNIPALLTALQKVFSTIDSWQMKVLIVDDTSPDKTYQLVEELQPKYSFLHLLVNKKKSGLGGAYLKGMKEAFTTLKADVVFEFDADLSHDPTKIPDFLSKIDQGADMVLGSRYRAGGGIPQDWGVHRKFLSVVGNLVIMVVFGDFSIRDWTSGFRAITKSVYKAVHTELTSERFSGYTFQIGFLHKTVSKGFKVVEVPFQFVDRTYGESKLGPEYIFNNLHYILKVRLEEFGLLRFAKFGLIGGLGATIQLTSFSILRLLIPDLWVLFTIPVINQPFTGFLLSQFISIELAIISNFILNNSWTFADRKLTIPEVPTKFATFNLASGGSILIQLLVAAIGKWGIGLLPLFTLPLLGLMIDTGHAYAVLGIVFGLFWNFFAYKTLVWRQK